MRKILIASAVGLALVGGQAAASVSSAQSLRVGDRIGAPMGVVDGQVVGLPSWLQALYAGAGGGAAGAAAVIAAVGVAVAATYGIVEEVAGDDEDASGN